MTEPADPGARDTSTPPAIRVQHADGPADLEAATDYLDAVEEQVGVPLVDEAERERLRRAVADGAAPDASWRPVLAVSEGSVVGYAAVAAPSGADDTAVGDLSVPSDRSLRRVVRSALLSALVTTSSDLEVARLQVWMRHVTGDDLTGVAQDGFGVARRLGILGRRLAHPVEVPPAGEWTVRAYRPGPDDGAVVAVLAGAYEGTDDGGWTSQRFAEKRALPWFRAEDLLVAEAPDGRLLGLHWLKRRGEGVGEVYNLAVHPDGQGQRLGPLLLAAGLAHLREVGCEDVLLWVDRANDRAVRLYESEGFTTRWDDVALEHPPPR